MHAVVATTDHFVEHDGGRLFARRWQVGPDAAGDGRAPIVLLHESLGCVALWRDFPQRLAQASGRDVVAYDRLGYGASDPHPDRLAPTFIEDEADAGFRAVREAFGFDTFVALGHSTGGSMAAACAARAPDACRGLVTLSAQAFVEDRTRAGVAAAQAKFAQPRHRERLAKYHGGKVDWVLDAWYDAWLSPALAGWTLDADLPRVRAPTLALHGDRDEYGSPAHAERIAGGVGGRGRFELLRDCGHLPHRDQPDVVIERVCDLLADVDTMDASSWETPPTPGVR